MCKKLEDYAYSSYKDYITRNNTFVDTSFAFSILGNIDFEKFNLCVNDEIISEYIDKIDNKFSKSKYILNKDLRQKIFSSFKSFEIKSDLQICRDPDDDKFINCAIDAKAIYIVSGDNDLLTIKNFAGIEIVTAREFYDKYLAENSD